MTNSEASLGLLLANPKATWRALDCADAKDSLLDFCGLIEVPGAPIEEDDDTEGVTFAPIKRPPAEHHKLLIESLEAVERGSIKRLMVFMPPGSAKSTFASVIFPVWFMGRAKRRNVIVATYASDLARKIGRRARSILRQPVYAEVFDTGLSPDSAAADEWALTNENEFMGGGILSGITGNRADCLRGDSIILTDQGPKRIEELVGGAFAGNVLSYDEHAKRVVYRPVQAVARRSSPDFYRVRTTSGRVVECTGDHRIYTARGYVQARLLARDDVLLRVVRSAEPQAGLPDAEGREGGRDPSVLRASLSDGGVQRRAPQNQESSATQAAPKSGSGKALRGVQLGVQAAEPRDAGALLLAGLQGSRSLDGHGRGAESWVAQRGELRAPTEALRPIIQEGETGDYPAGWLSLCGLRGDGSPSRPPHRHGCLEQPLAQSGDPLRSVSHEVAWGGAFDTEADPVALVERVREPTEVFDIQVEGTHCFFADGVLVHNCIIIDDPIKGRQQADSETIRKTTRAAYDDDLKTRLKPGGRIVLIQTRWHMDDLAGSLLPETYNGESGWVVGKDGERWFVISIPAEAIHEDDPLGRKPGEMLWPEWFDEDHWSSFRTNPRTWSALYQQRPQPDDGTYFLRPWLKSWTEKPANLRIYGSSDYAVTEGGGDYTVHRIWGVDHLGDLYRLDGWRGQTSSDRWIEEKIDLIAKWRPLAWFGEAGVIQKAVEPALVRRMRERKTFCRLEWVSSIADKPTRARGFQARAAMGKVWLEPGADVSEFLHFPAGKHDDDVDTASLIGRVLDEAHPAIIHAKAPPGRPYDGYSRHEAEESWRTA